MQGSPESMNPSPTLSVIVPVYNQEEFLEKCLDSLLNQKYQDLEIICVNDGSTDGSQEILDRYAAKDPRIVLVSKKNGGLSSARNAGMKVMRGKYVSFVDSDDYVHPDIYVLTVPHMDEYDFVQFNAFDVHGDEITSYDLPCSGPNKLTYEINTTIRPSVWNKLFNCEILRKYDLQYPEGLNNEDCMFSYAYRSLIDEGYFVNDRLYYYVQHDKSITSDFHKRPSKKNLDQINVMVPLIEFLERYNKYDDYSDILLRNYVDYAWFVLNTTHGCLRLCAFNAVIHVAHRISLLTLIANNLHNLGYRKLLSAAITRVLSKI